jgi:hypothetical protein
MGASVAKAVAFYHVLDVWGALRTLHQAPHYPRQSPGEFGLLGWRCFKNVLSQRDMSKLWTMASVLLLSCHKLLLYFKQGVGEHFQ